MRRKGAWDLKGRNGSGFHPKKSEAVIPVLPAIKIMRGDDGNDENDGRGGEVVERRLRLLAQVSGAQDTLGPIFS
jgi:hypothetical protein